MIIRRWQAPNIPDLKQMRQMFFLEGLQPLEETFPEGTKVEDRKFPFDEVRMIVEGEQIIEVAKNKLLLRPGDRIMIPSNTRHTISSHQGSSTSLYARKIFSLF